MQIKAINPLWKNRHVYFFEIEEFEFFEGEEIKPPKWVDGEIYLVLTTKCPDFPFRLVQRKNIISIDGVESKLENKKEERTVIVKGSKGTNYTVKLGASKKCDCSGFQFRHYCKHIALAEKTENFSNK